MGIQGRDYMRDRSVLDGASIRGGAAGRGGRVWLTWGLAGLFVVSWLLFAGSWGAGLHPRGSLSRDIQVNWLFWPDLWPDSIQGAPRYVQPLTTILFHDADSVLHLATTLALLLIFGPRLERQTGPLRLGILVIGGALVSVLGAWAGASMGARSEVVVLGATGGGFALAAAAGWSGAGIFVTLFGRGPWPVRRVVGVALVLALVCMGSVIGDRRVWTVLPFMLGHVAALGFGCLLASRPVGVGAPRRAAPRKRAERPPEPRERVKPKGEDPMRARVDQLLAKIGSQGLDALTAEERTFLEDASRRF